MLAEHKEEIPELRAQSFATPATSQSKKHPYIQDTYFFPQVPKTLQKGLDGGRWRASQFCVWIPHREIQEQVSPWRQH